MKEYEQAMNDAKAIVDSLKLTFEVSDAAGDVKDNWPNIRYNVTFSAANGKTISSEYRLGVGHVNWKTVKPIHFNVAMASIICAVQKNRQVLFSDKLLHARTAAAIARKQKVAPAAFEVLTTLCYDGQYAHDNSFDEWASGLGMDTDSIKAKAIYDSCSHLYHKVAELIGAENVSKLAELHSKF